MIGQHHETPFTLEYQNLLHNSRLKTDYVPTLIAAIDNYKPLLVCGDKYNAGIPRNHKNIGSGKFGVIYETVHDKDRKKALCLKTILSAEMASEGLSYDSKKSSFEKEVEAWEDFFVETETHIYIHERLKEKKKVGKEYMRLNKLRKSIKAPTRKY